MPSGQTLVVEGWQSQPGKHFLAPLVPNKVELAGNVVRTNKGNEQVLIETTIIELPDALWSSLGMESLITGNQALSQNNIANHDQTHGMNQSAYEINRGFRNMLSQDYHHGWNERANYRWWHGQNRQPDYIFRSVAEFSNQDSCHFWRLVKRSRGFCLILGCAARTE